MKPTTVFAVILIAQLNLSCTDENKIAAAFVDEVEIEEGSKVPFLLEQNFPNPFNPSTNFTFRLSANAHVRLTVITEDWQEVALVVNETLAGGISIEGGVPITYQFTFSSGNLPSGDYYYKMEALGYQQIRRMKIIK